MEFADSGIATFQDMVSRDIVCAVTLGKQKSPVPFGKKDLAGTRTSSDTVGETVIYCILST